MAEAGVGVSFVGNAGVDPRPTYASALEISRTVARRHQQRVTLESR